MRQVKVERELDDKQKERGIQPVLLSVGANLSSKFGDPVTTVELAIDQLAQEQVTVEQVSHFYRTPAFPTGSGPDFVNAAIRATSDLPPIELLAALGRIEIHFGRSRNTRWAPRTLDLDLIAVGDVISPDRETHSYWRDIEFSEQQAQVPGELILPHPRLQDRAFVLVPLADVAADWVHPVSGKSVREMVDSLPTEASREIKPI